MILFYTHSADKKRQIQTLCDKLGEKTLELSPKDLDFTLGEILMNKTSSKTATKPTNVSVMYRMPEVIVFARGAKVDEFLDGFKKAGIEPVELKAAVTLYNITWKLYDLIEELRKERQQLGG